jgi:predicted glycogen debranching enzyme
MGLTPVVFGPDICQNLDEAVQREWLETNGLGGFSSSTIAGLNSRRYHGLLTVATRPPVGRCVLLSKLEETVHVAGGSYQLAANRYPGAVYPQGHLYLREFRLDPFPTFIYSAGEVEIRKTVFMVHGENKTVVEYELVNGDDVVFDLRPLIAFRDYHSLTHCNDAINRMIVETSGCVAIEPYHGMPALYLAHSGADISATGDWYFNFEYDAERQRGLDYQEDLFNPLAMTFSLQPGRRMAIIASTEPSGADSVEELRTAELRRRRALLDSSPRDVPVIARLTAAADQYVVRRGELETIIAGYHWFSDWGRDTMIALPGIALVTGRYATAKRILAAFAGAIDRGMLPNRFPDAGEAPEYNTVDATLWFFEAVRSYLAYSGDREFVLSDLYPKLKEIVDWHLRGTRYGIRVDNDGLLLCGAPGVQLTWMDVKIGDWVVTPRYGKPVEVQALWYNALCVLRDLAVLIHDTDTELFASELSRKTRDSFNRQFWNADAQCLYDVVSETGSDPPCDPTIRPNQIFAVSLQHSMLRDDAARSVVRIVERDLLTPLGLRSLSPSDPAYQPRYDGGVFSRDSAYHQGTVWPWLMGPFITAYMRVNGRSSDSRDRAAEWLHGFEEHLRTAGLGQISEVADGSFPHAPGGCIAQAWSVAELLRAAVEEVYPAPEHQAPEHQADVEAVPPARTVAAMRRNSGSTGPRSAGAAARVPSAK